MLRFFPSRTVAIAILNFEVHWYGLLYLAGFVIAWMLLPRLQKFRSIALSTDEWSGILSASVLGVIIGGRLGFVLFYEPGYYLAHPLEIVAVWKGGMASHGGFIGVAIALLIALRHRTRNEVLRIADIVVVPVAIGLALGRIGNFINQELYGTVTTFPWGIVIPGEEGLRHPTQIYAVIKDLSIAVLCFLHLVRTGGTSSVLRPGRTFALFLMLYGFLRFLVEELRVQDHALINFGVVELSRGQLLTVPIFIAGVVLWWWAARGSET